MIFKFIYNTVCPGFADSAEAAERQGWRRPVQVCEGWPRDGRQGEEAGRLAQEGPRRQVSLWNIMEKAPSIHFLNGLLNMISQSPIWMPVCIIFIDS